MNNLFKIDENEIRGEYYYQFDEIAKRILNKLILKTPTESYLIREIEFYYSSKNHTDFYCHKNDKQLTNTELYFHRFKNPEKYLKLKMKGIDITCGKSPNFFGGVLIRCLQSIRTGEIITGIGTITNIIIDEIGGADVISNFFKNKENVFDQNSIIHLAETKNNKLKIYKKSRMGLTLKKEDSDEFYFSAKYNYFTYPEIEVLD